MVILVQFNPELAKSTPNDVLPKRTSIRGSLHNPAGRSGSISSRKSIIASPHNVIDPEFDADEDDDEVQVGHNFTYIPPNPKKYYRRLLEMCLDTDLAAMHDPNVNDDDQVSLGILSARHIELINECALRWRISQAYRAACFLDLVKQLYERNEVPLDCVPEALGGISKVMHEISFDKWNINDVRSLYPTQATMTDFAQAEYLVNVYGGLVSTFLASVYHSMEALPDLKRDDILHYLDVLAQVKETGLLERFDVDIVARVQDIKERVGAVGVNWYQHRIQELQSTPGVNRALPLLLMTDDIEKRAKALDKRFPEPILHHTPVDGSPPVGVDVVALLVEATIPLFLHDLEASKKKLFEGSMNGPTPDVPIQDIFSLYRRTRTMLEMFEAFCSQ